MKQKFTGHEEALVKAFFLPSKKARYLSLLESRKGRLKFLSRLDHFSDLDPRYVKTVPPNDQTIEAIVHLLEKNGAPSLCHLISSNHEIDNQDLPLAEALRKVLGMGMGTFISCIPGKLAYFEGEDENERLLLERLQP